MPKLYQHVPVQAEQFEGDNNPFERLALSQPVPFLQTPHGVIPVVIGDWVVRVARGIYDVVKPDMFRELYAEYVPPPPPPELVLAPPEILPDWDPADEDDSV